MFCRNTVITGASSLSCYELDRSHASTRVLGEVIILDQQNDEYQGDVSDGADVGIMPPASGAARMLGLWRDRLIDLSGRNPLLSLKERGIVRIVTPQASRIWESLSAGTGYDFPLVPDPHSEDAEKVPQAVGPRTLGGDLSGKDLYRRLKRLMTNDKGTQEEQGVSTLYVSYGVLHWRDQQGLKAPQRAPLLLFPVQLQREGANLPYELLVRDDDPQANPALAILLRNNFQLELPGIEGATALDPEIYFSAAEEAIAGREGWSVTREMYLCRLLFTKLAMYEEMRKFEELYLSHPVTSALAGGGAVGAGSLAGDFTDTPEALDRLPVEAVVHVTDADSSQLLAIRRVLEGHHMVIEGPPGTGKSQTITNIIAALTEAGKSVLFVSEKAAALEVVYKRLRDVGLEDFTLMIHSQPNRGEIVRSLANALQPEQDKANLPDYTLQRLKHVKDDLAQYVSDLHTGIGAADWTPYYAFGQMAKWHDAPRVTFGVERPLDMTREQWVQVEDALQVVTTQSHVSEQGDRHPWFGLKASVGMGMQTQEWIQELLVKVIAQLRQVKASSMELTSALHLGVLPEGVSDVRKLMQIADLVLKAPLVGGRWFEVESITMLTTLATEWQERTVRYRSLRAELSPFYDVDRLVVPSGCQVDLADSGRLRTLCPEAGSQLAPAMTLYDRAMRYLEHYEGLAELKDYIPEELGAAWPNSVLGIRALTPLIEVFLATPMAQETWLGREEIVRAQGVMDEVDAHLQNLRHLEEEVARMWGRKNPITQADVKARIDPYRGLLGRLFGGRRLRKALDELGYGDGPSFTFEDALALEASLGKVEKERAWFLAETERHREMFGPHFAGPATDWARIRSSLAATRTVVEWYGPVAMPRLTREIMTASVLPGGLQVQLETIRRHMAGLIEEQQRLAAIPGVYTFDGGFDDIRDQSQDAVSGLKTIMGPIRALLEQRRQTTCGLDQLLSEAKNMEQIREHEAQVERSTDELAEAFGPFFKGVDTDWDLVLAALAWCRNLFSVNLTVNEEFRHFVLNGGASQTRSQCDVVNKDLTELDRLFGQVAALFRGGESLIVRTANEGSFDTALAFIQDRNEHLGEFLDWLSLVDAHERLMQAGFSEFVSKAAAQGLSGRKFEGAFVYGFFFAWLGIVAEQRPSLASFAERPHQDKVVNFRALEQDAKAVARHRVREKLLRRRPYALFESTTSEPAVIQKQAQLKKRFMPLRKLFAQIPTILPQIKPCMIMSPIWVSVLLNPEVYKFDTVIFDEASQVLPEDGLGAIVRSKQVVVVGDPHQLPPTSFFAQAYDDDDAHDDEEVDALGFGSLLEMCLGSQMPQTRLRWHYRSHHESLIAFSNAEVYDRNLVTFPSAVDAAPDLGVQFVKVNGIYDRGGTRSNLVEAQRVAELVREHAHDHPTRSLGVVTLSQPQMEAVGNALEQMARADSTLDRFINSKGTDAFFVKNLERVQGDERDVIFLSIGYGPDASGKMYMNFGPLSVDGGYRRLNVAITRARDQVKVISSIEPTDLASSYAVKNQGVRMLAHYLAFAKYGQLEQPSPVGLPERVEFDSPLEETVYEALTGRGWEVRTQVGVGRYRIDLAVVDPSKPGRYLMGVECDGAAYHGTPTARERDWLRQRQLEGLGWRIARVWAPDWIRRRSDVLERLQAAYDAACRGEWTEPMAGAPDADRPEPVVQTQALIEPPGKDPGPPEPERLSLFSYTHAAGIPANLKVAQVGLYVPAILREEAPIHLMVATRRLYGKVSENRLHIARQVLRQDAVLRSYGYGPEQDIFAYLPGAPILARELADRKLWEVPPEEIATVAEEIVRQAYSIEFVELTKAVARQYGIQHNGTKVQAAIERAVKVAITEGRLLRVGDRVQRTVPAAMDVVAYRLDWA